MNGKKMTNWVKKEDVDFWTLDVGYDMELSVAGAEEGFDWEIQHQGEVLQGSRDLLPTLEVAQTEALTRLRRFANDLIRASYPRQVRR